MNLEVRHSTDPSPPTCFAALSTDLASSLSQLTPYSSLTILKLTPQPPTTAPQTPIHIAWSAATVPHPRTLSLHPLFSLSLSLPDRTPILATIAERITNTPRHPLRTATLRPQSYDLCHPTASPAAFQLAAAHFKLLSTAASLLESSLLTQIRVLQPRLTFPLHLPAHHHLLLHVVSIHTPHSSTPHYAVLTPHSEIIIQPPPAPPPPIPPHPPVSHFLRVLPPSKLPASGGLRAAVATHAVVHGKGVLTEEVGRHRRHVVVSRKRGRGVGVPVALAVCDALPEGHVALPSHVWRALALSSFMPVLVDEVWEGGVGEPHAEVRVEGVGGCFQAFCEWAQVVERGGVYFEGMWVREGRVRVGGEGGAGDWVGVEVWDRVGVKAKEVSVGGEGEGELGEVEGVEALLRRARENRRVRQGFRSSESQLVTFVEGSKWREPQHEASRPQEKARPLRREETKRHALLSLTKAGRDAIDAVLDTARTLFCDRKARIAARRNCRAVAVEGALGCGKTHVCKAVASLLRELASARTIWIRGKVHSGESLAVSQARIRRAFLEASDGGPGLVVLDDVDLLFGARKKGNDEARVQDPSDDNNRQCLADTIETQICKIHPNPVLLLLSCELAGDMEASLKCPGLMTTIVDLPLPTASERALLYWTAMQDLDCYPPRGEDLYFMRKEVTSLGDMSEGYSPKDIQISLTRARVNISVHPVLSDMQDLSRVISALKDVLKDMIPARRAGITFSGTKPGEALTWSDIGGLEHAKNAIWQVLQLPGIRPDIFAHVPIRLPHGILLYGPPGCGKTLLARTAVKESGMRCVMVKGPELLSKYIGESEAEVRRAFEKASNSAPCVLLFDEFDSLAPRRGGESTGVADRVVNTLLTCMDGAERLAEGVYVMATSSRPELIDPALLRPGRLDRWIPVDIPSTTEDRLDVLKRLSTKFFPSTTETAAALKHVAERTEGYTGADLGAILNDAHLSDAKRKKEMQGEGKPLPIDELLTRALRESRPSLSRAQRDYFEHVMGRFNTSDTKSARDSGLGSLVSHSSTLKDRVALQ